MTKYKKVKLKFYTIFAIHMCTLPLLASTDIIEDKIIEICIMFFILCLLIYYTFKYLLTPPDEHKEKSMDYKLVQLLVNEFHKYNLDVPITTAPHEQLQLIVDKIKSETEINTKAICKKEVDRIIDIAIDDNWKLDETGSEICLAIDEIT